MKKLAFLAVGAVALALSACGGNNEADTLNAEEAQNMEAEALNNLAAEAANAELEALGNQAQQLEAENTADANEAEAVDDTTTSPSEVEDNVQGM
jgi:hypothetical protein